MRREMLCKSFAYFLAICFLLCMNGLPEMVAEAREMNLPIGEMISRGEVKFEARENAWKKVEASHFPVFQGVKIKTEKGAAAVAFANTGQIEVGPNSVFFFDQMDRFILSQGNIQFRIPSGSEVNFKVGSLSISKPRTLQAANDPSVVPQKSEEAIGTISIRPNGSVTVKTIQGRLSIFNQDGVVLAELSSKDSATIFPTAFAGKPRVMVAQAGETAATEEPEKKFLDLATPTWVWIGIPAIAVGAGIAIYAAQDEDKDRVPICP